MKDSNPFRAKANLAFVTRGSLVSIQLVLDELQRFIASHPDLELVFSTVSANRLWVKEGEP